MTADDLRREPGEVVVAALRSGFAADDIGQAFTRLFEWHQLREVPR
jgi:hypothetical protein